MKTEILIDGQWHEMPEGAIANRPFGKTDTAEYVAPRHTLPQWSVEFEAKPMRPVSEFIEAMRDQYRKAVLDYIERDGYGIGHA